MFWKSISMFFLFLLWEYWKIKKNNWSGFFSIASPFWFKYYTYTGYIFILIINKRKITYKWSIRVLSTFIFLVFLLIIALLYLIDCGLGNACVVNEWISFISSLFFALQLDFFFFLWVINVAFKTKTDYRSWG